MPKKASQQGKPKATTGDLSKPLMRPNEAEYQARSILDQWRMAVEQGGGDPYQLEKINRVDEAVYVLARAAGLPHGPKSYGVRDPDPIALRYAHQSGSGSVSGSGLGSEPPPAPAGASRPSSSSRDTRTSREQTAARTSGGGRVPAPPKASSTSTPNVLPHSLTSGDDVTVLPTDEEGGYDGVLVSGYVQKDHSVVVNVEPVDDDDDGLRTVDVDRVRPMSGASTTPRPALKPTPRPPSGPATAPTVGAPPTMDGVKPVTAEEEATLLKSLWAASYANGHTFGISDRSSGLATSRKPVVLAAVKAKGWIEVADEIAPGTVQFLFTEEGRSLFQDFKKSPQLKDPKEKSTMPKKTSQGGSGGGGGGGGAAVAAPAKPSASPVKHPPRQGANGLKAPQVRILRALVAAGAGGLTRKQIAEKANVNEAMSDTLGTTKEGGRDYGFPSLIALKYVTYKQHDVDGKDVILFTATAAGKQAMQKIEREEAKASK